jgi:hypothetical protein
MDYQNVIVCCYIDLFQLSFIDIADKICAAEKAEVTCITL